MSYQSDPGFCIKIGIFGHEGSGGSQIIHRYLEGKYQELNDKRYYDWLGFEKNILFNEEKIGVRIWRDSFPKNASTGINDRPFLSGFYDCFILMADPTVPRSKEIIIETLKICRKDENFDTRPVILVSTKNDAPLEHVWNPEIFFLSGESKHCDAWVKTSAFSNENISELFDIAISKRMKLLDNPIPIQNRFLRANNED